MSILCDLMWRISIYSGCASILLMMQKWHTTHTRPTFDICILRHLSSDLNSMAFNFVRSGWNCWIFLFFFLSLAMRQSIKWGYDSQSVTNEQNALRPVGQSIETKEEPIERKTAKCYSNIVQIHKCRMLKSEQRGGGGGKRTECAVCRHLHTFRMYHVHVFPSHED